MKTTSRFAVAAAAGLFAGGIALTPAQAADLGGDCCADLEERVAELEATTVRKGNRKVSLKISGQVDRVLMFWDDGDEQNVYEADNTNSSSRVNFTGSAQIRPGWSAGYRLIWEVDGTDSAAVNQIDDDGGSQGDQRVEVREANWWIKSDKFGEIQVGRHQPATDNLILLDLGGGIGASNAVSFIGGGFLLRNKGVAGSGGLIAGTSMGEFIPGIDTARREGVMYYSPTIGGVQLLASWGEDDTWDVAARVKKQWNSVQFIGGIGYLEQHDEEPDAQFDDGDTDQQEVKGSASILHVPSGLFATGAFVHREYDGSDAGDITVSGANRPDFDYFYASGGIYRRWNDLGKTSVYGEYFEGDDGITGRAEAGLANVTDSELQGWGIGVNQRIDNAAMELFAAYRHFEYDVSGQAALGGAVNAVPLEDLDIFYTGARIKF